MSGQDELPDYVKRALHGLTKVQRYHVERGCISGDCTMATVRALMSRGLFYHHIDSPNGRCGPMRLTPLGVTVQGILNARAAPSATPSDYMAIVGGGGR